MSTPTFTHAQSVSLTLQKALRLVAEAKKFLLPITTACSTLIDHNPYGLSADDAKAAFTTKFDAYHAAFTKAGELFATLEALPSL